MFPEADSSFDARIRRVSTSIVITIPKETVDKLKLKEHDIVEIGLRKAKK